MKVFPRRQVTYFLYACVKYPHTARDLGLFDNILGVKRPRRLARKVRVVSELHELRLITKHEQFKF